MVGKGGNDTYVVDNLGDVTFENAGEGANDSIYTSISLALNDSYEIETLSTFDWAGTAAINLTGNALNNYMIGNAGANLLDGRSGADILVGKGGNDAYFIDNAGDNIFEDSGGGADAAYVTVSYTLRPDSEVETLSTLDWNGTAAIDLTGNNLANYMIGNAGANVLNGGGSNDILVGKGGADTFAFTTALGAGNVDYVADFVSGTDKIGLDHGIFGMGVGALSASAFVVGTAAGDADDRVIYNSATGQLFYDADGNGAGAAVLFATLEAHPTLSASDFAVI
jgi:Ca2+-binding RTX toxin-like protein